MDSKNLQRGAKEGEMEREKDPVARIREGFPAESQQENYSLYMQRIKEAQISEFGDLHA